MTTDFFTFYSLYSLLSKSVKCAVTSECYQAADMFAVHDNKLFSGILIIWFLIILVLLEVALLLICCLICYLLTSFSWFVSGTMVPGFVCTPVRDIRKDVTSTQYSK